MANDAVGVQPAFATGDGLELPCTVTLPPPGRPLRAAVVLVHGLGDHSGSASYAAIVAALAPRGYACFRYDQRGFGRAPGPRTYAPRFAWLRDDLTRFIRLARATTPEAPCFLLGVSLGGLIALDQAILRPGPLTGVAAIAPALGEPLIPALLRRLAPVLSATAPRLRLASGIDLANLSRDAAAARAYVEDPLYELRISARLGAEVMQAMREVLAAAPRLALPLLLLHGDADRITAPAGSRAFARAAGSADVTLVEYPGAVHNPLIDRERDTLLGDVIAWLDARTDPAVSAAAPAAVVRLEHGAPAG